MTILFSPDLEQRQPGSNSVLVSHLKARAAFLTIQHPPSMKL